MAIIRRGNDIYLRRSALRRTQAELATEIGVTNASISNWETGNVRIHRDTAAEIEVVLRRWEKDVPPKSYSAFKIGYSFDQLTDEQALHVAVYIEHLRQPTRSS